jgi:hypothetical protein
MYKKKIKYSKLTSNLNYLIKNDNQKNLNKLILFYITV